MTEEELIKLSEEKYPGSTKKTGPFGVLLRGKRGAYIQGHTDGYSLASQEHREELERLKKEIERLESEIENINLENKDL